MLKQHSFYIAVKYSLCVLLICMIPVKAIGEHFETTYSSTIAVTGSYAYVGDGDVRIIIINLNESPQVPVYYNTDFGWINDLAVNGDMLYVAAANGLFVLNISDRVNPASAGEYTAIQGVVKAVCVAGNYAYISDYAYGFQVIQIDASDPYDITMTKTDENTNIGDIWNLSIGDDGYLYVADVGNGLTVWSLSTPSEPVATGSGFDTNGYAIDVIVRNGSAYVADACNGVVTLDASSPSSSLALEHTLATTGYDFSVTITGDYLCVSDCNAGVSVYDISSQYYPDGSNRTFQYSFGTGKTFDAYAYTYDSDDYVITANGENGVYTLSQTIVPPTIVTHPQNQTVEEGSHATFSVEASGALLEYQWQRNSSNISGATSSIYTTQAVYLTDNGDTFRCVVSNTEGSLTSNSAILTVMTQSGDDDDDVNGDGTETKNSLSDPANESAGCFIGMLIN